MSELIVRSQAKGLDLRGQSRWHRVMGIRLSTLSLNTTNPEVLVAFYQAMGADLKPAQVKIGSQIYRGQLDNLEIEIYQIQKKSQTLTPDISIRFEVSDIATILERLKQLPQVQIMMDLEHMPDGQKAIVLDPDGRSVEIISLYP